QSCDGERRKAELEPAFPRLRRTLDLTVLRRSVANHPELHGSTRRLPSPELSARPVPARETLICKGFRPECRAADSVRADPRTGSGHARVTRTAGPPRDLRRQRAHALRPSPAAAHPLPV